MRYVAASLSPLIPRRRLWLPVLVLCLGLVTVVASLVFAAGAKSGESAHPSGARWDGMPLDGRWERTALASETYALVNDPQRPSVIWAGTAGGIRVSSDGGLTWQTVAAGSRQDDFLSLGTVPGGDAMVAGTARGAVYLGVRQLNGSWQWRRVNRPLGSGHPIFSVALAPRGGLVLAGTFGSLYRGVRTTAGWAWRRVARTGDSAITSIAWASWNTRLAYAAVFGARPPVLTTRDSGRTWHADTQGLPSSLPTQALSALRTHPPRVILTTMGGGVWERVAGAAWHDVSAGLPGRHGMPLVARQVGGSVLLYTGTMGFGVYGKEGTAPWRRVGTGLDGGDHTVLGLAGASKPHPVLLAGTALGVFRYVPTR